MAKSIKLLPLMILTLLFSFSQNKCVAQCEAFMKYGLYDEYDNRRITSRIVYKKMTESTFESFSEMKSVAANLGLEIPVKGIPVKGEGSFSSDKERAQSYQKQLLNESKDEFYEYVENNNKLISEKITDLVKTCLGQPGLSLWIKEGGSDSTFVIGGRFINTARESRNAVIENFTIAPSGAYIIESRRNLLGEGRKVSGNIVEVVVRRITNQPLTVVITSNESHKWLTDNTLPALNVTPVFFYRPTKYQGGHGSGDKLKFSFINDKDENVRASVTITFNIHRSSHHGDDHTSVEDLTLHRKVNGSYSLIENLGSQSFYQGAKSYTLTKFIDVPANSIEEFLAQIILYNRMDLTNTTIHWRIDY